MDPSAVVHHRFGQVINIYIILLSFFINRFCWLFIWMTIFIRQFGSSTLHSLIHYFLAGVLRQSSECQRQLLPDQPSSSIGKTASSRTSHCYGPVGGYADPRCPANQHWAAHFTLFHYLAFLKLLSWPLLFALFARTAKRVEEEAEQIWRFQLYSLATGFRLLRVFSRTINVIFKSPSLRPCLPPPLTPIFLLCLACCRFRAGSLSGCCIFPRFSSQSLGTDHPDMNGQAPHSPRRKFSNVYKNPSVKN
jgi:hypothetical protein